MKKRGMRNDNQMGSGKYYRKRMISSLWSINRQAFAVQSGRASQTDLEHLLLNYLADRRGDARASSPRIFVTHRLDQPVEGIMVFAKTAGAAAALSSQIQKQQITKEYVAVVGGIPNEREGRLTDWLRKDGKTNVGQGSAARCTRSKKGSAGIPVSGEAAGGKSAAWDRLPPDRDGIIRSEPRWLTPVGLCWEIRNTIRRQMPIKKIFLPCVLSD